MTEHHHHHHHHRKDSATRFKERSLRAIAFRNKLEKGLMAFLTFLAIFMVLALIIIIMLS
jgi:hypothetical protein